MLSPAELTPKSLRDIDAYRASALFRLVFSQNTGWNVENGDDVFRRSSKRGDVEAYPYELAGFFMNGLHVDGIPQEERTTIGFDLELSDPPFPFQKKINRFVCYEADPNGQMAFVIDPARKSEIFFTTGALCIAQETAS